MSQWVSYLAFGALLAGAADAQQPLSRPKPSEAVSVIRAGHLIDVVSGRNLANQTIIIRGTKIEAIGSNLAIPDGAQVIDLSAMTVLPGLIDCIHGNCSRSGTRKDTPHSKRPANGGKLANPAPIPHHCRTTAVTRVDISQEFATGVVPL